jgi:TP901 family phage tail tape measure protein
MAARSFSIEAIFKAVDRMSNPLKGMNRNTSRFARALRTDFAKAQRSVDRFTKNIKQKLGNALRIGLLSIGIAAVAGVGLAAKEFIQFDQTITGATARFKDLVIGSKEAATAMVQLKKTARDTAKVTQFTATEAAAGLNFFAKAGFTSTEAMAALKTQVDLATVAELDLARTSDITSDLLGALGLNAADSAVKIANLEALSNSLGIASNMANVTLEDMFETLKIAGPIATAAGEKMNPLIAITASLGSAGIKGSQAATALKNAYINLATNAPAVEKALASIGLAQADFVDQKTGTLDMVKAMQLMGDATRGMGNVEQLAVFSEVFGKRAVAGAVNISKSLSEIDLIFRALEGDKKIAEIADEIRKGLGMQIKILISGLVELGFKFVEAFEKAGAGALEKLIKAVQNFDPSGIINFLKKAFETGSNLFNLFVKLSPVILSVVGAMALYKGVLLATALLTKGLAAAMAIMRGIQFIYIAATQGMTVAQAAFNGVALANPIGLIVVAIGLLIGAGILLVKNWDKVKRFFIGMWFAIKDAFLTYIDFAKGMLFTFADIILTIFGNVFKAVLTGASKVGEFLGFDTSGLDATIAKIEEVQAAVRKESMIGGRETRGERIRTSEVIREEGFEEQQRQRVQPPVSSAERANVQREESLSRAELLIRDETGRAEMTQNPNNNNFKFQLSQSGGI